MPNSTAQTRIMVFGTFDIFHPGHESLLTQARKLARRPYLIVSVARDANVRRIKGKRPLHGERSRAAAVRRGGLADRVVLGGLKSHIPHILKECPDIIALGYDQREYVRNLKADLAARGLKVKIVRLKSHKPHIYKTSKIIHHGHIGTKQS